jgi:hypothetical protein
LEGGIPAPSAGQEANDPPPMIGSKIMINSAETLLFVFVLSPLLTISVIVEIKALPLGLVLTPQ